MQSEFCTFLQSLSTFITFHKCVRPTKTTILVCDTHRAFGLYYITVLYYSLYYCSEVVHFDNGDNQIRPTTDCIVPIYIYI